MPRHMPERSRRVSRIHPTALVDPAARLADDVEVGPYCLIEPDVEIGPGTVLRSHVIVRRYTTLGNGNFVDSFTVLGGEPQDVKFRPETVSFLRIGDDNRFREHVTIHRGSVDQGATVVGSRTFWMATSHAGHDVTVGDEAVLVNGAEIGGHARLGRGAILSSNLGVHQFCRVGERVMARGNSIITMHVPPYVMTTGVTEVVGLNTVGLRRAGDLTDEDRRQIKEAYRLTYRSRLTPAKALEEMDRRDDWGEAACRFREFVREALQAQPPYARGLAGPRRRRGRS